MKHLTPIEFVKERFDITVKEEMVLIGYDQWIDAMAKYHDHALECAADEAEVEATGKTDGMPYEVDKQSILSLKINKEG